MTAPTGEPNPGGLEGTAAAWQETNDALHDAQRRYRELVEYSLGLICTHDLNGNILSINSAAASLHSAIGPRRASAATCASSCQKTRGTSSTTICDDCNSMVAMPVDARDRAAREPSRVWI